MNIRHIANTGGGQDGAIFGRYLFRFNARGLCRVYDLAALTASDGDAPIDLPMLCEFTLDRADEIVPHSNAVCFGSEYYAEGDEFPLLYSNIYNNYAKAEDKLCGVCCVYRLQRDGAQFTTTLVQLIEIGFVDDAGGLWRSAGEVADVRPYGNFAVDAATNTYWGFVMRDGDRTTRYFAFDLPRLADGEPDPRFGVRRVTLTADDIRTRFDTPYHNYIQGACFRDGKIYSVEGFHDRIHPALRIIDTAAGKQELFFDLFEAGYEIEAEFIDFYEGMCLYSDAKGHVFELCR